MRRVLVVVLLGACGSEPPPEPVKPKAAAAKPTGATAALAPTPEASKDSVLADVRKRQLTNEDFVETENNRDPFHSFLSTFAVQPMISKQHKIVLEKFALDELKLVAIVGGEGTTPRAVFIDPSSFGTWVVRGDHMSKADALVTRIAPDRVFMQIEEDAGSGKPRMVERVLELHAGEGVSQ